MGHTDKKKIAIITTNMDVEYSVEILRGIQEEAKKCSCDISIFNAFVSQDEMIKHNIGQYNIYKLANLEVFDGVILFSNLIQGRQVYDSVIEQLKKANLPIVCIDAPVDGFYYVGVENYYSMKAVVEHFIEHHGFTRINYISGQSYNSDSQMRLDAYRDALTEHGIAVEEKRISYGTFSSWHGREAAMELLQSGRELPQAVVCANDAIAIGFIGVMQERGVRVPQDIAVSGFDNTFEARNSVPRLATVDRALVNVGREAVIKINSHLEGGRPKISEVFPAVPVFAESCGCYYEEHGEENSIRERYLLMAERIEHHLLQNAVMTEELNDSKSFDDMLKRLKGYISVLECDRFYFCLDSELVKYMRLAEKNSGEADEDYRLRTEGYAPTMSAVLCYEYGKYVEYDDFPTERMWPNPETEQEKQLNYVFSPVHFRDRCFGYVIVEGSEFVLSSILYRNWLINLSNSLENIRKQANLQRTLKQLDRLYIQDPLTGLYNRSGFARYTAESFRVCARENINVMILFVDMDGLKKINDKYGHDKGDMAIVAVADALRAACLDTEVCARFGGDEYVVYAEDYKEEDAKGFCARFEAWMEHYNIKLEQPFRISASYGYQIFVPEKEDVIDKYIDRADEKMYDAKRAKKKSEK